MTGDDLDPYLGRALVRRRRRHRGRVGVRRLADHDVRREHRRHGGDPRLLDRGLLRGGRWSRSCSASARSSARSSHATPGGVLGGITVVLYGMIGLLGAKIWIENRVDFANPINLVPLAAGIILGIGGVTMKFTDNFSLGGIALGTIVALVAYHLVRLLAPATCARRWCRGTATTTDRDRRRAHRGRRPSRGRRRAGHPDHGHHVSRRPPRPGGHRRLEPLRACRRPVEGDFPARMRQDRRVKPSPFAYSRADVGRRGARPCSRRSAATARCSPVGRAWCRS